MRQLNTYWQGLDFEALGAELVSKVVSLLLLFALFFALKHLLRFIFKKIILKSFSGGSQARQRTLLKLLQNSLNYSLYFILGYWVLVVIGVPITSLLAGAGIAGLAIGLGAQGFLTDVVNGVFILIERQFDVGETVMIQNVTGVVKNLGLRTTQLVQPDGSYNYIPNRHITVVTNLSRGNMRAQIDLPIPFASHLSEVYRVIEAVNAEQVSRYPAIVGQPVVQGPRTLPTGQMVFRVDIMTQNGQQFLIYKAFYHLYHEALRQSGILN